MKRSTKHLVEKVAVGIAAIGATFLGMKKYEQKREADKAAKAAAAAPPPPAQAPATSGAMTPASEPAPVVEEKKEG